jgi:hypothetical protein
VLLSTVTNGILNLVSRKGPSQNPGSRTQAASAGRVPEEGASGRA